MQYPLGNGYYRKEVRDNFISIIELDLISEDLVSVVGEPNFEVFKSRVLCDNIDWRVRVSSIEITVSRHSEQCGDWMPSSDGTWRIDINRVTGEFAILAMDIYDDVGDDWANGWATGICVVADQRF